MPNPVPARRILWSRSYTYVVDLLHRAERLQMLSDALDGVEDGVILFDGALKLEFINKRARGLWRIPETGARGMTLQDVVKHAQTVFDSPPKRLEHVANEHLARIRDGDANPHDIRTIDGKTIRARCTRLAHGRRMLTYCDVTDLVSNAERLKTLATTDSMTGVFDRRHFLAAAEAELSRFQRYHRPLALIMLDIDNFRSINDRFGNASGDDVIRNVAKACSDGLRRSDVPGRLGGEEFAILLPETRLDEAQIVADRVRERIASQLFAHERTSFRVTASLGVAAATLSTSGVGALMRNAELALYEAKSLGRNRCATFAEPLADLRNVAE